MQAHLSQEMCNGSLIYKSIKKESESFRGEVLLCLRRDVKVRAAMPLFKTTSTKSITRPTSTEDTDKGRHAKK